MAEENRKDTAVVEALTAKALEQPLLDEPVRFENLDKGRDPHNLMMHEERMLQELGHVNQEYNVGVDMTRAVDGLGARQVTRTISPVLSHMMEQQAAFNASVTRTLNEFQHMDLTGEIRKLQEMAGEIDGLRKEIETLKARLAVYEQQETEESK